LLIFRLPRERSTEGLKNNNDNNNNKIICIAPVRRLTLKALGGQLQWCYTVRARHKCLTKEKCLNRARELEPKVSVLRE